MIYGVNKRDKKMAEIRLCGIDASTKKTGMAFMKNGYLDSYELLDCSSISDREERLATMCKDIVIRLKAFSPTIVYIEDSWNAANVDVTKLLTKIMGVVYGWCLENNVEYHDILPSQWRKYAGITQGKKKRSELKEASINYVKEHYNIDVNDDVADSIALADSVVNYFNILELE